MTRTLPNGLTPYKHTPWFTETSVPKGLLADHTTRAGTWGRLEVSAGSLTLRFADHDQSCTPQQAGVIPPAEPHAVVLDGPVRFRVVFLKLQS